MEWVPYVAMCGSFTGLVGVLRKAAWGPLLCGVSSGAWAVVAFTTSQVPWGLVEVAYSLTNLGIGWKWSRE